jgi:hypothetical protein
LILGIHDVDDAERRREIDICRSMIPVLGNSGVFHEERIELRDGVGRWVVEYGLSVSGRCWTASHNLSALDANVQANPWYHARMRIRILAVVGLAVAVSHADAQRRRGGFSQGPTNWLAVSGGISIMNAVPDGRTSSTWDFGNGFPLRASIEHSLGGGNSIGLEGSYVRAPLLYTSFGSGACGACNAHATVASYGPVLRLGEPRYQGGFYQVLELFAGVLQYGNFTEDASGQTLPPNQPDKDFAFSIGFGLGHSIGRDFAIELNTSQMRAIHERTGLLGNAQTTITHTLFLLGLRMGF